MEEVFSFGFDYAGEIYDGNYKLSLKELGFIIWNDKTPSS